MQTADLADSLKVSALHLAAQYGHSEVVKLLIEAGAVVNCTMTVRDIYGVTPLHLAVQNEHLDVMDILIAAGCDVHSSTEPQSQGGSTEDPVAQETTETSDTGDVMESSC
jgi:ankyrin repeat protein